MYLTMLKSVQWKLFLESKNFIQQKTKWINQKNRRNGDDFSPKAGDRAKSHLPVVKPKTFVKGNRITTQRNIFGSKVRKEKTITKGLKNNGRQVLLVGLTEE